MLSESASVSELRPLDDDLAAPFQIEGQTVRGRLVRLGPAVDAMLGRHAYPEPVARLLGEAAALAALVGSSLKFEGRLILQAQGDGPVAYLVVDYDSSGGLRGYCRFDAERISALEDLRAGAADLLGQGVFIMTVDPTGGAERYQGVTAIEGDTLALCAEEYFAQSEQVPTRVRLAVGRVHDGAGARWRAGGMMIQSIAWDQARGSTEEGWLTAQALFSTLGDDELVDPRIAPETLLYRLFHEEGVRLFPAKALVAFCRCSGERVTAMLKAFPTDEIASMAETDGRIHVTCEYCARRYDIEPHALEVAAGG
jgi:molecular chaperone Hsp33